MKIGLDAMPLFLLDDLLIIFSVFTYLSFVITKPTIIFSVTRSFDLFIRSLNFKLWMGTFVLFQDTAQDMNRTFSHQ